MTAGILRAALREQDASAEQVGTREVERVVGDVEQRDRATDVVECGRRAALEIGEPSERPVEPNARVGVGHRVCLVERRVEHGLGALEVAEVGERVAEVGREANLRGEVFRRILAHLGQAALENLDGTVGPAGGGVSAAERREDVGPATRRDRRQLETRLEPLDRVGVASRRGRRQPERDVRARGRDHVAGGHRCVAQRLELLLGFTRLVGEPELELGVGDAKLALVGVADLRAGLEVVGRDAELLGEHPQRLDRRAARAGLDSRDVGVRDAGARQLALRQPALVAQASQALADRLGLSLEFARHRIQFLPPRKTSSIGIGYLTTIGYPAWVSRLVG